MNKCAIVFFSSLSFFIISAAHSFAQPANQCSPLLAGGIRDTSNTSIREIQQSEAIDAVRNYNQSTSASGSKTDVAYKVFSADHSTERAEASVAEVQNTSVDRFFLQKAYAEQWAKVNAKLVDAYVDCIRLSANAVFFWIEPNASGADPNTFLLGLLSQIPNSSGGIAIRQLDMSDDQARCKRNGQWVMPSAFVGTKLTTGQRLFLTCRRQDQNAISVIAQVSAGSIDGVGWVPSIRNFRKIPIRKGAVFGKFAELGYVVLRSTQDGKDQFTEGQPGGPQNVSFKISGLEGKTYTLYALMRGVANAGCFQIYVNRPVAAADPSKMPGAVGNSCPPSWSLSSFRWVRLLSNLSLPPKTSDNEIVAPGYSGETRITLHSAGGNLRANILPEIMALRAVEE
jgi:hypothetical protein